MRGISKLFFILLVIVMIPALSYTQPKDHSAQAQIHRQKPTNLINEAAGIEATMHDNQCRIWINFAEFLGGNILQSSSYPLQILCQPVADP